MIILLFCEPRTGSSNLANWFNSHKQFSVIQEPLNPNGAQYKKNSPVSTWTYSTDHLVIKEVFNPETNFETLFEFADKIILLYRENKEEQIESWMVASETKSWASQWVVNSIKIKNEESKKKYFNRLTSEFEKKYLSNPDFFRISYEDLYYNKGIQKVIDYLGLEDIETKKFPYGERYRVEISKKMI